MAVMPTARELRPLPVPPGERAPTALPALRRALDGDGPALLPVDPAAAGSDGAALAALGAGGPLEPGEDLSLIHI